MAGLADYSTTAGNNTSVGGVSIAEGMAPGNVNNAIRALMADLATFYAEAYREGNIVGTVTESSGDPTGAAMEFGSGANGAYCRLANGWQFCLSGALTFTRTDNSTAAVTWTFPAAFIGSPWPVGVFIAGRPITGANYTGMTAGSVAGLHFLTSGTPTTSLSLSLLNNGIDGNWGSGANIVGYRLGAIGLWFDPTA